MTDKKLTDSEIVKALENCRDSHLWEVSDEWKKLSKDALDLINRQNAKIDTLQKQVRVIGRQVERAKAEAYKEFAERLKEYIDTHEHLSCEECECVPISKDGLDNLLKEMVGVDNARK